MKAKSLLSIILLLFGFTSLYSQVTIAPVASFSDDRIGFSTLTVMNNGEVAQEVIVDLIFGYPSTNELGESVLVYDNEEAEARFSIIPQTRVFPRQFILQPGQRQAVRINVRPNAELEDGTYWSRVRVASVALTPDVEQTVAEGVGARIAFRFEQLTAFFYKKGNVTTGLELGEITTEYDSERGRLTVKTPVTRTGNSPFIGTYTVSVLDSNGNQLGSASTSTTAYFDVLRIQTISGLSLTPGTYTAEVRFETRRSDIPSSDLVQTSPIVERVTFVIE